MYNQFMTYLLQSLRHRPVGLWPLDSEPPFEDYSSFNRGGDASSVPALHASLANGTTAASVFDADTIGSFDSPVFIQGQEDQPFTLEVVTRVVERSSELPVPQQILGHTGAYDGLVMEGTIVSFIVKYLNTGESRIDYDLQVNRAVHLVAVHTLEKNALYVDGELVAETTVTQEQQNDSFVSTDGKLYSGETTGSQALAVNNVIIYSHPLPGNAIMELFNKSRDVVDYAGVPAINGGELLSLGLGSADTFLNQTWNDDASWQRGSLSGLSIQDGGLIPQFENDTSVSGEWLTIFDIASSDTTSIYAVVPFWDGEGVVVEASLNGEDWEVLERGQNIELISPGMDPTDELLQVRVSFPGGIVDDDSYIESLNLVGVTNSNINQVNGRVVSLFPPATIRHTRPVIEMSDDWGVDLAGGRLTIEGLGDYDIGTQEFWLKRTSDSTITMSPVGGQIYLNGRPANIDDLAEGEWTLVHIKRTTPIPGDIYIYGNVVIGQAAVYEEPLDDETILDIYLSYTGKLRAFAVDDSSISMTEYPSAVDIYAHDWSITGAG